jgi:hypothetical protein
LDEDTTAEVTGPPSRRRIVAEDGDARTAQARADRPATP